MSILKKYNGLYTDLYELNMAQGYFLDGRQTVRACFDYFIRTNPFKGGYTLFAGLSDLLSMLKNFKFDKDDCAYLKSLGFKNEFLNYFKNFELKVDIYAPSEGEVIFPNEPVLRIEGNLIETQLIETVVLNIINFESLIATKASRIRQVAGDALIADFGLRRAQGLGGIHASRATIIGGFNSTSNVYSANQFGLTPVGTQAHSWIQSFENEISSFRQYAKHYPDRCILLVDTYDTLKSGIPNAITVAKELEQQGNKLFGVRLDSGDLAYLSKKARKMLNDAGLDYVKIIASNQLDEYLIKSLKGQGACIDAFGVGTSVITGHADAALDGVYKLSMSGDSPRMKMSENKEKMTLPGIKKIVRLLDDKGKFYADAITLDNEENIDIIYHPYQSEKSVKVSAYRQEPILRKVMEKGSIVVEEKTVETIAEFAKMRLMQLPDEHKRFENPHLYKIGISEQLKTLQETIIAETKEKNELVKK